MIGQYDGAPDPLSPGRLKYLIADCEANIKRLRTKGLHQYVSLWEERKRGYERRLDKQAEMRPLVIIQRMNDAYRQENATRAAATATDGKGN